MEEVNLIIENLENRINKLPKEANYFGNVDGLKYEIKKLKKALALCEVSGSFPTKEEISTELENHINKWGKSHTEETNNAYALGFRHCFHFISDLYKVKR